MRRHPRAELRPARGVAVGGHCRETRCSPGRPPLYIGGRELRARPAAGPARTERAPTEQRAPGAEPGRAHHPSPAPGGPAAGRGRLPLPQHWNPPGPPRSSPSRNNGRPEHGLDCRAGVCHTTSGGLAVDAVLLGGHRVPFSICAVARHHEQRTGSEFLPNELSANQDPGIIRSGVALGV